jgi:hypothetical protein
MTGTELRNVFESSEFKRGLKAISSYLSSIMQERPIVYLLAKCLWRLGHKFELEDKRHDLSLDGKRIEFKFNYDRCEKNLRAELAKYGHNLEEMWDLVQARAINKSWGIMPKIYEDVCVRKPRPDIFVWIICSRDLSKVAPGDLKRICLGRAQRKYNATHPYVSDGKSLVVVDSFLGKLQAIRSFRLLPARIQTRGTFPSTYHFRICEFGEGGDGSVNRNKDTVPLSGRSRGVEP